MKGLGCRWVTRVIALSSVACSAGASEKGAHVRGDLAPQPAQAVAPQLPQGDVNTAHLLDDSLCKKIDTKLAQDVLGKAVTNTFGVVEDTASGKRLRCEWQAKIRSLRASIYPGTSFWQTVVAGDDVGMYPNAMAAWKGEARANAFGFAFRLAQGGAVDVAMAGGKPDEQALLALGRAIENLVHPE